MALTSGGYTGKMLRVDLTSGKISEERLDDATLRKYPSGTCLGAKILYDEVPPGVGWSDPRNRLFLGSGPLLTPEDFSLGKDPVEKEIPPPGH